MAEPKSGTEKSEWEVGKTGMGDRWWSEERENGGSVTRRWNYRKEARMSKGDPGFLWGALLQEASVLLGRTSK